MGVSRHVPASTQAAVCARHGPWQERGEPQFRVFLACAHEVVGREPVLDAEQERAARLQNPSDLTEDGLLALEWSILSEPRPLERADEEREVTRRRAERQERGVGVNGRDVGQTFGASPCRNQSGTSLRLVEREDVRRRSRKSDGRRAETRADVDHDAIGTVHHAGHVATTFPERIADVDACCLGVRHDCLLGRRRCFELIEEQDDRFDLPIERVSEVGVRGLGLDHATRGNPESGPTDGTHDLVAATIGSAATREAAQASEAFGGEGRRPHRRLVGHDRALRSASAGSDDLIGHRPAMACPGTAQPRTRHDRA